MRDFSPEEVKDLVEFEFENNWDVTLDWLVKKIGYDPAIASER